MNLPETAAAAFAIPAAFPILGQLALVLGAPWGSITLGGRWPGVLRVSGVNTSLAKLEQCNSAAKSKVRNP